MESENDAAFAQLANKVTAFRTIASDISAYAEEDRGVLAGLNGQMETLSRGITHSVGELTRVMRANPKVTRMVALGFAVFVVLYYMVGYLL